MSAEELIAAAFAMPPAGRHPTDTVWGAVQVMRQKGYTYAAIHAFLIKQGANVHPVVSTFTSVMSRRMKRARIKALGRDAK